MTLHNTYYIYSLLLKHYARPGDVVQLEDWLSSIHETFGSQHGGTYLHPSSWEINVRGAAVQSFLAI